MLMLVHHGREIGAMDPDHLVEGVPGVTGAILGGRSPQQVDGWIGAASLQLSAADLQDISNAIVRTGAGEGPTMPQLEYAAAH
jgi:hypothetical protein